MTFKLFFAFVGIALIIYASTANALSLSLQVTPDRLEMQQGSTYSISATYGIEGANQLTTVYTEARDYPKVQLTGDFSPIKMQDTYAFDYEVEVAPDAFPGIYNLEMEISAIDE